MHFSGLLCSFICCLIFEAAKPVSGFQNEEYRLPTTIWPTHYRMEFFVVLDPLPGFERFTAPAKSWITVNCSQSVSTITMHAINLTINENTLKVTNVQSGVDIPISGISYREEFDFFNIHLLTPIQAYQSYEIFVEFITQISDARLTGMYQDYYDNPTTGERRYIATTLFAPYHARRAFPCFDEPSFRATYDLTIGHHNQYHAMANTDIISSSPVENMTDWQWDRFATTPSISSYIIAMIVSDMTYVEASSSVSFRNVTVRVYAKPQSIARGAGNYSADLTVGVMNKLESMFIIEYPISKIYSVALPQFFYSAMENWGLITYREPSLLYVPGETTENQRFSINYVLSHEKAHQYFGNLVACNWWAYVWLKEGFATYYAYYAMEETNPELIPWAQFISNVLDTAMSFDASNRTHPLENFPPNSEAVAGIYTTIPYQKGASILRMATSMFTEAVFLDGIREYVREFQYRSVVQDDLFEEVQKAVDRSPLISNLTPTSVKTILDTWTVQAGFPIVTVSAPQQNTLQFTQQKFIDGDTSNPDATYWVPIFLFPRPNQSLPQYFPDTWIPQNTSTVSMTVTINQFVLVNAWAHGYYRVLYEAILFDRITQQLIQDHTELSDTARTVLFNDYASFLISGHSDAKPFINLSAYLSKELSLPVWQGLERNLIKISKLLGHSPETGRFQKFFGRKAFEAFNLLQQENISQSPGKVALELTTSLLMKISCGLENSECSQLSRNLLLNDSSKGTRIPLPLQETAFCTATKSSTNEWDRMYRKVTKEMDSSVFSPLRSRLIKSLGCSEDRGRLKQLVTSIAKTATFTTAEKIDVLKQIVHSEIGVAILLEEWQRSNDIVQLFRTKEDFRQLMDTVGLHLLSDAQIGTLEKARDTVKDKKMSTILSYTVDQLRKNHELHHRLVKEFSEGLYD